ncbi:hypothetical protein L228DRAFT_240053 [Xylona heveae TC161]|uniref:Ataxin-10 homolog n=1 Tax=Xylona heveae (strain CBS 132557 / TC161) TaxID=1328760 RepID=A0A165FN11_XYLHT|nr:hypothetical protein L228DRAFT_240053 [Xylona heveae TC161]KZF21177.1 hypothetical protein L228DRAFT_240053 [Xylona heveae TC161]
MDTNRCIDPDTVPDWEEFMANPPKLQREEIRHTVVCKVRRLHWNIYQRLRRPEPTLSRCPVCDSVPFGWAKPDFDCKVDPIAEFHLPGFIAPRLWGEARFSHLYLRIGFRYQNLVAHRMEKLGLLEAKPAAGPVSPYVVQLKLVLLIFQAHFDTPGLMKESTIQNALEAGKVILDLTQRKAYVREALGFNKEIWAGMADLLAAATPELERQSFSSPESVASLPNTLPGTCSTVIAFNFATLFRDIERVNDICIIARNCLATKDTAQDFAALAGFDAQVLKLIDICVRVTARGYDGEAGTRSEEKWQRAINAYKKLLITCLQFLHNLVMGNERRKLLLWLDLFCPTAEMDSLSCGLLQGLPAHNIPPPRENISATPETVASSASKEASRVVQTFKEAADGLTAEVEQLRLQDSSEESFQASAIRAIRGTVDGLAAEIQQLRMQGLDGHIPRIPPLQDNKGKERVGVSEDLYEQIDNLIMESVKKGSAASLENIVNLRYALASSSEGEGANTTSPLTPKDPGMPAGFPSPNFSGPVTEEDKVMTRTPEAAALTLETAKKQLMDRLRDQSLTDEHEPPFEGSEDGDLRDDPDGVQGEGSLEDEDDDYQGPGDQERGLLTDVPLILGPHEIEALPMIIQTGIVNAFGGSRNANPDGTQPVTNMQAVRCNILLAQEVGRNLLRELLIFVAAWDLQDEDFYTKLMVQIMQAVLENGLLPFTYMTFGEAKDIISPAQAVIVKILTSIFRQKQAIANAAATASSPVTGRATSPSKPLYPSRVEVVMVRYLFSVFRQSIIPETCALIYLQGQIHAGNAIPDVFPLNLWDVERVYEGVYQFLEFFAVLTEHEEWKSLLIKWELVNELVTLLRELEESIPKGSFDEPPSPSPATPSTTTGTAAGAGVGAGAKTTSNPAPPPPPPPPPAQANPSPPPVVSVERPFDTDPGASSTPGIALANGGNGPLALPPTLQNPYSLDPSVNELVDDPDAAAAHGLGNEYPQDFEWRNLKKLVILVLSSLVWKSPTVQNQVRQYGGMEQILSCCRFDQHNPYIREHAIMCLRFLLEGNRENQQLVHELEPKMAVPSEVLDKRGYETFIDDAGKVGLRRKDGLSAAAAAAAASANRK